MKLQFDIIICCAFAALVSSSGMGKCPEIPSISDFDSSNFTGEWFEVERSFYLMELAVKCTQLNVTNDHRGNYDIAISSINRWTGNKVYAYGTAIPLLYNSSVFRYKVNTKLPFSIARFLPGVGIYKILYTDYEHVAIIWYCKNILFAHNDRLFVFGRERYITEKSRIEVYELLKSLKLNPDRLIMSKNSGCST